MKLPEYITVNEVRRVCKELGVRDWTNLKKNKILPKEAKIILREINSGGMKLSLHDFLAGLEVELEHGMRFKDANVTNNHPILTGKIVLAHLKESLDYYKRLEVAELEGDLLKALRSKNSVKVTAYLKRLIKAKHTLSQSEAEQTGLFR
ncbi:MAG: hypothetical protein HY808_06190 [Nitrospirae bacterium]|nr:hypothetical protein [Nitrospirota bacterium]